MQTKQSFLTRGFIDLKRWTYHHPIKACAFTSLFLFCGALWEGGDWRFAAFITFAAWLVFELCVRVDLRRIAPLLVVVSMATTTKADEPEVQPAPIVGRAVAVAVVVGGGWVVVKLRNFCKRKFPKGQTNAPPEEFRAAGEAGEYGALFNYDLPDSCELQAERRLPGSRPQGPPPVVFTSTIVVDSLTNFSVNFRADVGEQFVQDAVGLQGELAGHGFDVFAESSYERNGHPCEPEQVPITFNRDTRTVTLGTGGVVITVECSADLRRWEPLLTINVSPGTRLLVPDATAGGAQFYRTTLSLP